MTDADYIACGLTPPSSTGPLNPKTDEHDELANPTSAPDLNIAERLRVCREHFRADRLTTGAGGTALECYKQILKIDPGNVDARAGLEAIADKYAMWARTAYQRKQIQQAKTYLDRLETVDSTHTVLRELRADIIESERAADQDSTDLDRQSEPVTQRSELNDTDGQNKQAGQEERSTSRTDETALGLSGLAKIYYFRGFRPAGMLRKFPFAFQEHTIGRLSVRQYLYFYIRPQVVVGPDNCQFDAQPGTTYYLRFHLKADMSAWGCKLLEPDEAVQLLDKFTESEDFTPITLGAS